MDAKEVKVEELYGKWYEQCVDGAVLTIEENTMTYERKDKTVRSPYQFRKDKEGHDLWYFVAKDIPSTFEQIIYHPSFNPELDGLSTRMAMVVYDMIYHPKNFCSLHMYIFKLLVQAGLDYVRNEFHSTKPMLCIPYGNVDDYLIKMDTRDDVKRKAA